MAEKKETVTLYVRGMNKAEVQNMWDDTNLNYLYDNALDRAAARVAQEIAMETNTNYTGSGSESAKGKNKATKEPPKPDTPIEWKEGMPCRAIYEADGLEYEAFLIQIMEDGNGIVKFLGYDNSEQVQLSSLKRSLGDAARMQQIETAEGTKGGGDDGFESQPGSESVDQHSDESSPQERSGHNDNEMPRNKKKKSNKKKSHCSEFNYGDLPTLTMPTMNLLKNMGDSVMPLPPPPPLAALGGRSDAEEQAISDMLLSWYMTGYYTGLYQGMKRQRQSRRYQ